MASAAGRAAAPARHLLHAVSRGLRRLRPEAGSRPPWERSVLDDLALNRPWNVVVKAARLRARSRRTSLDEGTTVVIVSWNTREVLGDVLRAVQRSSPPATRVLVVDNGSDDGTRDMLARWAGIDVLRLPANAGHGVALDLGMCAVRTRVAVTLDSDAIPLSELWLAPVVAPLSAGEAVLAGLRSSRGFVHPAYLAVDTATFLEERLSFQVFTLPGVSMPEVRWGENAWDTGELLSRRVALERIRFVDPTPNPADGLPGMTAGGVVYHHGGLTRAVDGVLSAEALAGWRNACRALGVGVGVDEEPR